MTDQTDRCEWSDLLRRECAHCGASPGDTIILEPARPPVPRTLVDSEETRLSRPELPSTWVDFDTAGACRCGAPTRDSAVLCDGCQERFIKTLADLGPLDEEIDTTMTRQRATSAVGGSRSAETGLPWHDKAAEAKRKLHGLLVTWVRFCIEEHVRGPRIEDPADNIASLSAWLTTRVHGLALHELGADSVDEITDAAAECHRLVFWKRRSRLYLGPCRTPIEAEVGEDTLCPGEVYAEENEPVGYCDLCGQGATVVIRRAELERDLDGYLATAAEIARLATYLGLDVPRDQVRKRVHYWHRHHLVEQRSSDADGSPMFRYGEVRRMLYKDFGTRSA